MNTDAHHIETYGHEGKLGVMIEIALGTTFTARMPEFRELAHAIALQVAGRDPRDVKQLLKQTFVKDDDVTIERKNENATNKHREPIEIVRFIRWTLDGDADAP